MAGGKGSRLNPLTLAQSKHLLPIYNKPMVYYPLSTLLLSGASEILVVVKPSDRQQFKRLLGDGNRFGVSVTYQVQDTPRGIADGLKAASSFIQGQEVAVILGDNFFFGSQVGSNLSEIFKQIKGATVFSKKVHNPSDYGIVELGPSGSPISLEEKPTNPKSNKAVTGLYFYDSTLMERIMELRPSPRGELEITDVNASYLTDGKLDVVELPRGTVWIDAGSVETLQQANDYVRIVEERQGLLVSSPEEIAWRMGLISGKTLRKNAALFGGSAYGDALLKLL